MISCIVLSAGLSSRFQSPKALASIAHTPAIVYLLKNLCASQVSEIVVVLGASNDLISPIIFKHKLIQVVYNNDYKFGQTSSVQTGLKKLTHPSVGFMILPVDCPFIQTKTVNTLIAYFLRNKPDILIPKYQNFKGHPPIFKNELGNEILKLDPSKGLNTITQNPIHRLETLDLDDPGITQTFNTPEELEQILKTRDV